VVLFARAADAFRERRMRLFVTTARCSTAQLLGNEAAAEGFREVLRRAGVANPEALVAAYMPSLAAQARA